MSVLWRRVAAAHRLDDAGWARHANPWSGWTRFATGWPLLLGALWSLHWIDLWALIPIALVAIWLLLNPRAFPPARSDAAWMSRGAFGERLWVEHPETVPLRHRTMPRHLTWVAGAGVPFVIYGLIAREPWAALFGVAVATLGKLWFVDRMALLYDEAVAADPSLRYRADRIQKGRERT